MLTSSIKTGPVILSDLRSSKTFIYESQPNVPLRNVASYAMEPYGRFILSKP